MTKIKCKFCGHEWETKSKYNLVSCPSCGNKNRNVNKDDESYIDMDKKTKIKFVYQKKVLKEKNVCGLAKGEVDSTIENLSKSKNIPIGEISVEFL